MGVKMNTACAERQTNGGTSSGFIHAIQIHPHFHPIVDIFTGSILGYEVLARGTVPFESPYAMFREAARLDAVCELEMACCNAALTRIASFEETPQIGQLFHQY